MIVVTYITALSELLHVDVDGKTLFCFNVDSC